ncbi:MAG: hypothetical protein B6244_05570 [Candidatus Cloacimonetes bacterium 4572_55]|nr:MAG: hypothetical protein B6244_05570 [Candidatus Cloacimonetes bacterium 4572_55]
MRKAIVLMMIFASICFLTSFIGCGGGAKVCKPADIHDTPENHYFGGRRTLEKGGDAESAKVEFDRALCLDPTFAPALEGLGMYYCKIEDYTSAKTQFQLALAKYSNWIPSYIGLAKIAMKEGNFAEAHKNFDTALGLELTEESGIVDRLENRTKDFHSEATYFKGLAYQKEGKYDEADGIFSKMRESDDISDDYKEKAIVLWNENKATMIKQKKLGADYESIIGKDVITRQELSAILHNELPSDKIYKMRLDKEMMREIQDIGNAWAKDAIQKAVESKMLALPPNGMFNPDEKATKGDLAQFLMIAFANMNKDESLLEKYSDLKESPFYDVPPLHPAFNGIMFVTESGFMTPAKGTFGASSSFSFNELFWTLHNVHKNLK